MFQRKGLPGIFAAQGFGDARGVPHRTFPIAPTGGSDGALPGSFKGLWQRRTSWQLRDPGNPSRVALPSTQDLRLLTIF